MSAEAFLTAQEHMNSSVEECDVSIGREDRPDPCEFVSDFAVS